MLGQRIFAVRRQEREQLPALVLAEAGAHAYVLQRALIVKEAEQQGTDLSAGRILVPAKPRHHAIAIAFVLDLEHHALVGLIAAADGFGDHSVKSRALEAVEPIARGGAVACSGRDV